MASPRTDAETLLIALTSRTDAAPGTGKYKIVATVGGCVPQTISSVDAALNPANIHFTLSR